MFLMFSVVLRIDAYKMQVFDAKAEQCCSKWELSSFTDYISILIDS